MFKPVDPNQNFIDMEKKWLKHWPQNGVIGKYLHKNDKSKDCFSFQDGPITANNPMGVHHAWGRTYKDLWQKFNNLLGKKQRFRNGFDCQGLWVEVEVEKELGLRSKKDIENLVPGDKKASIAKFVELCKQRVLKYAAIQTEQSKRLGYFMDWDHSYFTMSDENNYMIWQFLKKCYENGWIYKGHESVPWCPRCETAISQHEMLTEDYKEIVHEAIFFKLPIIGREKEYLLVWTTTPWTIPANIAVAVDGKLEYSLVKTKNGDSCWITKDAVNRVFKENYGKILKTVLGQKLVGLKYKGPFDDLPAVAKVAQENPGKFHLVIPTDENILPISTEEGTGMVHTAVSAGVEDFKLGKKLGLPMIPVINDDASYLPGLGFLTGKNAKKHPRLILDYLNESGNWVFEIHNYKHRYPACWRCKTELVWKVADEWYIAMDSRPPQVQSEKQSTKTLRERMVDVAKKIHWIPEFGLDRELDWLKNMHDWLISKKNRYWGLALPIYECNKCAGFEIIGSYEELKKRATKGWEQFENKTPHKPYIDEVIIKCSKCNKEAKRIEDVGNPWLDAGIVPYSTISENNQGSPLYWTDKKKWREWFPVDFITESFPGQFKNWFYAMIAMSSVMEDEHPFKTVLGFATLLSEDGRPMHKSWGNSIEFNEGADTIGVDVMRWMYARQNPSENILFGPKKASEVRRQFYLMLWNIYRFFIDYANLDKVNVIATSNLIRGKQSQYAQNNVNGIAAPSVSQRTPRNDEENVLDLWLLNRFYQLVASIKLNLSAYNPKDCALATEEFVQDLSTWYIRRSRDRVWINSDDPENKTSFYNTLYFVLKNMAVVLSPFLPFITEEIYTNLTENESVHLSSWPEFKEKFNPKLIEDMAMVRKIAEAGHRVRKDLKIKVRQPLAQMTATIPYKFNLPEFENQYKNLIEEELNIKKVDFKIKKGIENIQTDYDTKITDELKKEGALRDLIRQIQAERKALQTKPDEYIKLTLTSDFEEYKEIIKKRVLAKEINFGDKLAVTKL